MKMPKINSIHFGLKWITLSVVVGIVVPAVIWLAGHIFLWGFCVAGIVILAAFLVVLAIEMHQDFGSIPYYQKHLSEDIAFDSGSQRPVIRSSICTGEKVAGFKNLSDGRFTEVMLIKSDTDKALFMKTYGIDKIDTEY